ncbi:unnamed protein product [Rotaria sordida]|uniref:Tryptophan 2,3-dioxygenase n=2 Tax=Rotaria sordida TaxID=392033 RepID=A0A814XY03_9BILA|nr:unnamed protein product [Rotaria sordida]
MSCPYARQMSNDLMDTNNDQYNNGSDTNVSNPQMNRSISVNGVDDHSKATKEPLNYTSYLGLNKLLSSLQCVSHIDPTDNCSPPVHDEHFFILIHQVFELWFKGFLYEIDSIRNIFSNSSNVMPLLFHINQRLHRSVGIWKMLIDMLQQLETMTPIEFLAFRDFVTPASGFQSLQFRLIEMTLGLTDIFRKSYKTDYFINTMFKGKQRNELKQVLKEDSLLKLVERWLEYVYDSTTSFKFLDVFTSSVESFINHGKKQKIVNGVDIETAERAAENIRRQFSSMIDPVEYEKLLDTQERRLSQKAMLAALMISLYHPQPCFQQAYQMLGLLMDIDALIASWRHKHILLVQRQIGQKPGTGGTGGFSYLHQTAK